MNEDDDPRAAARRALVVLRDRVDDHFDQAEERSPGQMQCRAGCDMCCHARLTVFAIEAERIASALATLARRDPELRERVRRQADDPAESDHCALLVDGRCSIYADRPLICRSHGLPIAVTDDEGETTVDCCPLNFRGVNPPVASILRLDALNRPLAVMAQMIDPSAERIGLDNLARAPEA